MIGDFGTEVCGCPISHLSDAFRAQLRIGKQPVDVVREFHGIIGDQDARLRCGGQAFDTARCGNAASLIRDRLREFDFHAASGSERHNDQVTFSVFFRQIINKTVQHHMIRRICNFPADGSAYV